MQIAEELYTRFKQPVYGYLVHLCRNPSLAEDLLSDTFLAALVALPSFRGEADVKTWLFSIARHKWYDHLRRTKREITEEDMTRFYLADNVEQQAVDRAAAERATALLAEEEPRVQKVVRLRMEGYSFYEIGQQVGLSENSARVMEFRAKKKLRERLQQEGLQ